MPTTTENLVHNLNAILESQGWTRAQLAAYAGVEQTTLNRIFNAHERPYSPGLDTLDALAAGLKMTVAQLVADPAAELTGDDLASRVKAARERRGLTASDLAAEIDVSPTAVYQIETGGTKELMAKTALRISDVLQVELRWLVLGEGPATSSADPGADPVTARARALARHLAVLPDERISALGVALGLKL